MTDRTEDERPLPEGDPIGNIDKFVSDGPGAGWEKIKSGLDDAPGDPATLPVVGEQLPPLTPEQRQEYFDVFGQWPIES